MSLGAASSRRELEEVVTAFCDAFNRDGQEAVMGYFEGLAPPHCLAS